MGKMKMKNSTKSAKRALLGRVLRRLLGEEKGAVMMEYIVVGLLIAAACVLAVAFFGSTVTTMFASLAQSMTGDPTQAAAVQNAAGAAVTADFTAAKLHNDNKHSGTATGDVASTNATF